MFCLLKEPTVGAHPGLDPGQMEAGHSLHVAIDLGCGESLEPIYEKGGVSLHEAYGEPLE